MFIEQDKEHAQSAIAFHTRANISEVRLVDARVRCSMAIEDAAFPLESTLQFRAEDHVVGNQKVKIGTRFRFHVTTGSKGPKKPVFLVECRFDTDYELRKGYEPSNEEITAFKDAHAIFNTWPFFREFLNTTATRMGYPAPTVPFLRIVPKVTSVKEIGPAQVEASKVPKKERKQNKKSKTS